MTSDCHPVQRSALLLALVFLFALPAANAKLSPLLWRVSSEASAGQVYLLGSIHFGHDSFYPLPAVIMDAYHRSGSLAVELDLQALDQRRAAALMMTRGRYPPETTLRNELDEATWSRLQQVGAQLGVEVDGFLSLQPWLVAVQLVSLQMLETHYRRELGVDRHFLQLARGRKPIRELETMEQQLAVFAQFSAAEQALFLRQTLQTFERGEVQLERIATAWKAGDRRALESAVLAAFRAGPGSENMFRLVFTERNARMVSAVVDFLARGERVFMVVGVGHVLGEEGIVARLDKAGYRLQRLSPDAASRQPARAEP